MKAIKRALFLLFFAGNACLAIVAQESQYFLHTVEKGQNLYSISSMYGVSQADIIRLNPGSEEKINAGQMLRIPQKQHTTQGETFHTIQPGETLYRVTSIYNVSAQTICEANPGLSAANFRAGEVIRIPLSVSTEPVVATPAVTSPKPATPAIQGPVESPYKDMHKVKRKETVYSISREYGITEQELRAANPELKDGLKHGKFLRIPYPAAQQAATQKPKEKTLPPTDKELFRENKEVPKKIDVIKAAIILPFTQEKKMVEYYEGLLIAVDSLKRGGVSIDLHVYNSGSDVATLNTLLAKPEMKKMHIIFGPLSQAQINPLATFAKKNEIRLVIPFSSKDNEVFNNPYVYQINTPQSYLYSEVYDHFLRQFPNANVIFLESTTVDKDKMEFIKGLKQELKQKGIPTKTLKENASYNEMKPELDDSRTNIFVPTSASNTTLTRIVPQLTLLVRDNTLTDIHLFGYPEWQMYTNEYLNSYFELDTYFYSSFYTNNLMPAAIRFTNSYYRWYGKEMGITYPKYGMLGFDTGYFFLKGLSRYGNELENNISKLILTPIQTGFRFQRVNNWGGFINTKVFFVHFTKDNELIKLDFE